MELNLRLWASKYKTGSNGPGPQGSSRWCRASWLSALRSLRGSTWNRSLSRLQRKQRRVMGCGSGAEIICLLLARKMKLHCGTTRSSNTGALGRLFGSDANAKCEYLTIWHQLSFSFSINIISSKWVSTNICFFLKCRMNRFSVVIDFGDLRSIK